MSSRESAQELARFIWLSEDEGLQRSVRRVKASLRGRVKSGHYMRSMAAGAWMRVADLASKICANKMKEGTDDGAPYEEAASKGKFAHARRTRVLCSAMLAEHFDKHLQQVEQEASNE